MAFGITQLINDIQSSIDGLVQDFKGNKNTAVLYNQGDADLKYIQSQLNQENWSKLSFPYTFCVVDLSDASSKGENFGFSDFMLPLAPQSISQSESPATNIKATQGGTTVRHGGLGYKNLTISGTTGIAPFRGTGGVDRKTGEAIFQPKDLKYKSGYEVFIHLRNWFKSYYEYKFKKGEEASNLRLVFKNYKDGEFLIVELLPNGFNMDKNSTRPFMYDYKIEMMVLAHLSFNTPDKAGSALSELEKGIETALDKITYARGVFLRSQGILRQIEATYDSAILEPMRLATLAIKSFLGVPLVAADIGSRILVNTVSTAKALVIASNEAVRFLSFGLAGDSQTAADINSLLDKRKGNLQTQLDGTKKAISQSGPIGLMKLEALTTSIDVGVFPQETLDQTITEQGQASELPKSFYEDTISGLQRVAANAEDFFNLTSTSYDDLFDRTSTLKADETKTVTDEEYDLLFAFNEAITGLYSLIATNDLFKSTLDERIKDMNDRFDDNIQLISSQAVRQMVLPSEITLERLAQQELGDYTRWGEIVEVNSLKPPYISDDPNESRDSVLKAGDKILIPTPVVNGFSQVPEGKSNKLSVNMSALEKSLGIDLKLDADFDLVLTSSGDIDIIGGADNMAQAILLSLSYEPGDLLWAPQKGAGLLVGRKFPPLDEIKDRIVNTLLQDPRIQRIDDLSLQRQGPGIMITFNLKIKQIDLQVPVRIKV